MEDERDFLDEMIAARTAANPEFPRLMEEAAERRRQAKIAAYRELAEDEERLEIIRRASHAAVDAGLL